MGIIPQRRRIGLVPIIVSPPVEYVYFGVWIVAGRFDLVFESLAVTGEDAPNANHARFPNARRASRSFNAKQARQQQVEFTFRIDLRDRH